MTLDLLQNKEKGLEARDKINAGLAATDANTASNASIVAIIFREYDTIADAKTAANLPLGKGARTLGYHTKGDGGGADYLKKTAIDFGSTPDEFGDHTANDGNILALEHNGIANFKQFGVKADGVTDTVHPINIALASGIGELNFTDGTYFVLASTLESDTPEHGLVVKSNTKIKFSTGSVILHESGTESRHIFGSGGGLSNVVFVNPQIDGAQSATNGIGINDISNCDIIGGFIRNVWGANITAYETSLGGGRAITFQSFKQNISILGVTFDNCSTCIDVSFPSTSGLITGGVSISNIAARDCEVIIGCLSGNADFLPSSEVNLNLNSVVVNGVTFRNCGKSGKNPNRIQTSFKRQNTTGNVLPWASPARTGTSYVNFDWLISETGYNPSFAEWDPTATYNVGDDVKYTEDGTNSALFSCDHTSGLSISNVRGYNEASYGTIGAIYRGIGANISLSDFNVTVDAKKMFWLSPNPVINSFGKPLAVPTHIFGTDIINNGTVEHLLESENPVLGIAASDFMPDVARFTNIYCDANTVTTAFIGPRLAGQTTSPWKASMELIHRNNTGILSGSALQLSKVSTSDASWAAAADQSFKGLSLHSQEIRTDSFNPTLRLTRTGSSAATVNLTTSPGTQGDYLFLDNGLFLNSNAWDTNLLRMGGSRLWVDSTGDLRIKTSDPASDTDGTIVGTQS